MSQPTSTRPTLAREMGLIGLVATGVCAMVGGAINLIPFTIQRIVPGIGPHVLIAYIAAGVPALFAALAYAILASAMPRAGGSYVYASRALSPYLGFVASFSQWFSVSVAIGVVSYVLVPFLRDVALAAGSAGAASALESGPARLLIPIGVLWLFTVVNLRGIRSYTRTVVPLMFLTLALGCIVIVAGFMLDGADYARASGSTPIAVIPTTAPNVKLIGMASVVLFSSFIGFDSIAQAGGEARDAGRTLPLAIGIAITVVAAFYFLFTAAVYRAVPWPYVAALASQRDVTAPGLFTPLLPRPWTVLMTAGAAVALMKDLPAMLLGVSRLMFAWAEDGIFPSVVQRIHVTWRTPHVAILCSAAMATISIIGCYLARDFFLGVDILVTSMLVNFLLMCLAVLAFPAHNPALAREVRVIPLRAAQVPLAATGAIVIGVFLAVQTWRDLTAPVAAWYFRSTLVWLVVLALASAIYWRERRALGRRVPNLRARFLELPSQ